MFSYCCCNFSESRIKSFDKLPNVKNLFLIAFQVEKIRIVFSNPEKGKSIISHLEEIADTTLVV